MNVNNLQEEASAFDAQILERVKNGHIPDLRRCGRCEYFYNNVWRDQFFAGLYFGELVRKVVTGINNHLGNPRNRTLLEVGCGPGHVSLELARNGIGVTGLDISGVCLDIARRTAAEDPWQDSRGALKYVQQDILHHQGQYDAVVFTASLHHFSDSRAVLQHIRRLLKPGGLIFADEPVRDRISERNVAVILLVKGLLRAQNSFFQQGDLPATAKEIKKEFQSIYHEEKYETEDGSPVQSVNDNDAGFDEMVPALNEHFEQLEFELKYALYHQLIGGMRLQNRELEHKMAQFLKLMDALLCETGAVDATNFFFMGRKRG